MARKVQACRRCGKVLHPEWHEPGDTVCLECEGQGCMVCATLETGECDYHAAERARRDAETAQGSLFEVGP